MYACKYARAHSAASVSVRVRADHGGVGLEQKHGAFLCRISPGSGMHLHVHTHTHTRARARTGTQNEGDRDRDREKQQTHTVASVVVRDVHEGVRLEHKQRLSCVGADSWRSPISQAVAPRERHHRTVLAVVITGPTVKENVRVHARAKVLCGFVCVC